MTGPLCPSGHRQREARDLGRRVRDARQAARLTLRELGRRCTLSAAYLQYIEIGKRTPSEDVLAEVARELELDLDVLLACTGRVSSRVSRRLAADPEAGAAWVRRFMNTERPESLEEESEIHA